MSGLQPPRRANTFSKLLDAEIVTVEAQGRHRYWRLADSRIAELLETLGANATHPADPIAPAALAHARTCYDHLAGHLAVTIYDRLLADRHIEASEGHLMMNPSGYDLFARVGADVDGIRAARRITARACLDWTQRRHHLAGAAGAALLTAFTSNGWVRRGNRPRSVRITETGRTQINDVFRLRE